MSDNVRGLVLRAVVHLRHLHAQPSLDPIVAAVMQAEIRRLEVVVERLDAHHAEIGALVEDARLERNRLAGHLEHATRTLQRVMQILGPTAPTAAECAGCASEIAEALAVLREHGIAYQPRKPVEDEPGDDG